mmetsp:Transcript_8764/g.8086  ORF Transcript_8764/g.8086 Transcript_8764/m.8086 type:complete len:412 (-) Transcript_8764:655-1890(-)
MESHVFSIFLLFLLLFLFVLEEGIVLKVHLGLSDHEQDEALEVLELEVLGVHDGVLLDVEDELIHHGAVDILEVLFGRDKVVFHVELAIHVLSGLVVLVLPLIVGVPEDVAGVLVQHGSHLHEVLHENELIVLRDEPIVGQIQHLPEQLADLLQQPHLDHGEGEDLVGLDGVDHVVLVVDDLLHVEKQVLLLLERIRLIHELLEVPLGAPQQANHHRTVDMEHLLVGLFVKGTAIVVHFDDIVHDIHELVPGSVVGEFVADFPPELLVLFYVVELGAVPELPEGAVMLQHALVNQFVRGGVLDQLLVLPDLLLVLSVCSHQHVPVVLEGLALLGLREPLLLDHLGKALHAEVEGVVLHLVQSLLVQQQDLPEVLNVLQDPFEAFRVQVLTHRDVEPLQTEELPELLLLGEC